MIAANNKFFTLIPHEIGEIKVLGKHDIEVILKFK